MKEEVVSLGSLAQQDPFTFAVFILIMLLFLGFCIYGVYHGKPEHSEEKETEGEQKPSLAQETSSE